MEGVENASNWVNDHVFTSDDEGNGENPKVGLEYTYKQKEEMQAYNDIKDFRDANQKATEKNSLVGQLKELTGWGGEPLENTKNPTVIDQMSMAELRAANLPDKSGACMFFSTAYGAADALGVTLTPEEAGKVYE